MNENEARALCRTIALSYNEDLTVTTTYAGWKAYDDDTCLEFSAVCAEDGKTWAVLERNVSDVGYRLHVSAGVVFSVV